MNRFGINSFVPISSKLKVNKLYLCDLFAVLYVIFALSASNSSSYMYVCVLLFFAWLFLAFVKNTNTFTNSLKDSKIYLLLLFLLYGFFCGLIGGTFVFSLKQFGEGLVLFSPILFFNYYSNQRSTKKRNFIFVLVLLAFLFYAIRALLFYSKNPNAARILASEPNYYGTLFIGGDYSLAYGFSILSVVSFSLLIERRIKTFWIKVLWLLVLLIGLALIFETKSTVSLVCTVVGLCYCLVFRGKDTNRNNNSNKAIKVLLFIVIVCSLIIFSRSIGNLLLAFAEGQSGAFQERLSSLAEMLAGKASGSEYALMRFGLPLQSLSVFLHHPFFGVAYLHGNSFYSPVDFGVANHCEWADSLANYGLFGLLFLSIYIVAIKETLKKEIHISKGWIVVLLFMGMFNPFRSFASSLAVFYIVPFVVNNPDYKKIRK